MRLARYWTRSQGAATNEDGEQIQVVSRGWSDDSLEDARMRARERAQRLAQRLATDPSARKLYDYDDAPVPEPVIHDFRSEGTSAVITRNSYGALVLNSDDLLFADVDQQEPGEPLPISGISDAISGLFSMFGGKREQAAPKAASASQPPPVDAMQRVAERHGFSVRVYQTAAGYRAVVTDRRIRAGTDDAEAILAEFGSDPMYMRLCRTQQSFRARLTPKPWRCDFRKPPVKFPYESPREQAAFQQWEAGYNQRIERYATCRFFAAFGEGQVHPSIAGLLDHHDRETKADSRLPLA